MCRARELKEISNSLKLSATVAHKCQAFMVKVFGKIEKHYRNSNTKCFVANISENCNTKLYLTVASVNENLRQKFLQILWQKLLQTPLQKFAKTIGRKFCQIMEQKFIESSAHITVWQKFILSTR